MKKAISLVIAALAMVMMMSACSVNGTPASMVGTWKVTGGDSYNSAVDMEIEIKSDDSITVTMSGSYNGHSMSQSYDWGKITKCTCNEIYIEDSDDPIKYELSCNTMIWKNKDGDTIYEMEKK